MNIEKGFAASNAELYAADFDEAERRIRRRWLIAGGLVVIALIAAFFLLRGGEPAPADKGANQAPRVTVVVPGRQPIASMIAATGTLAARRDMPVGVAGEGGMVSAVLVEPGDWVAAGQTLAVIDRQVQAEQANSLAATVAARQADAALAQNELERSQALVSRGFISRADIDRKTAARDAAVAQVRVAQAQLGEARARIGRLSVRAPAAGLVLTRAVEPGQIVGGAGTPLFRIARGGEMEAQAVVAESDLARLRVGVPAEVTPVGTRTSFTGQIWQLSPVINPTTRQGVARVALTYNPALRPGGFASVRIRAGMADAPLLPESAVLSDAKGNFVYVIDTKNKVVRRDVTVGDVSDTGIAVSAGLTGNEQVVLSAGAFLNPGDTVVPERQAARR